MADRAEIEEAVIGILARQLLISASEIAPDAQIDALGLDSLGKVEAIFAIEERFQITIPFNANEPDQHDFGFRSVPEIVSGVARLIAEQKG
ncbi:MAG: acyl carrier protein [Tabrizicola sp.]|nr:acyl carrier protein [Tabrizicola sp.]HMS95855.1 phosphopantetheine-binding protein [Tabrizicola sp.]